MSAGSTILVFHQTSDRFYPGINNVPPRIFFTVLDLLTAWRFGFQPDSGIDPDQTRTLTITFDDGYEDNLPVLEALCHRGIRPVLFIPTGTVGKTNCWEYSSRLFPARHLTAGQISRLSDLGVVIGSHGISHRSMTAMIRRRRMAELADSKKTLEDVIGKQVDTISFPFGRFDDAVVDDARACGYTRAFGLNRIPRLSVVNLPFVVRRRAVYGNDDYYSLRRRLVNGSRWESFRAGIVWRLAGGTTAISPALK